jgi:hypothetical protein
LRHVGVNTQACFITAELSCGCGDPACLQNSAKPGPFSAIFLTRKDSLCGFIIPAQNSERGSAVRASFS